MWGLCLPPVLFSLLSSLSPQPTAEEQLETVTEGSRSAGSRCQRMGGTAVQTETVRVIKRMRLLERFSLEDKQSKRRKIRRAQGTE